MTTIAHRRFTRLRRLLASRRECHFCGQAVRDDSGGAFIVWGLKEVLAHTGCIPARKRRVSAVPYRQILRGLMWALVLVALSLAGLALMRN